MCLDEKFKDNYSFAQRIWIVGGIFALLVVLLLLIEATFSIFILILAGALIAIYFRGLGTFIKRKTRWSSSISLALSVIITILIIVLLAILIGTKMSNQIKELGNTLPVMIENAKKKLDNNTLGQKLMKLVSSTDMQQQGKKVVSTFFKSTFGILGDI